MNPRRVRSVSVLVLLVALFACLPSTAAARSARRPRSAGFRTVVKAWVDGHCGPALLDSGSFMLVASAPGPTALCASNFDVFNDATGTHWRIDTRPCLRAAAGIWPEEVQAFGAPWVWFSCNGAPRLYNVRTRQWRSFPCVNGCQLAPQGSDLVVTRIGARWAEFGYQLPGPCGDGVHNSCGPARQYYENLATRRIRAATTTPGTLVDLDFPGLVRHLCAPLRVPRGGSLALAGSFAVASDATGSFLERCGSHAKMEIMPPGATVAGGGILLSARAVAWVIKNPITGTWAGQLDGIELPSLRHFTLHAANASLTPTVALDAERVYVVNRKGGLSAAPIPGR